ncbi:type VII secretion protein, YukD-like family protein [Staphylococcus pettenkoferi VCU012]|nr:type VII secretion protein, YukD-like family protein [Staphylococcus pettenkoferi VCU012]
MIEDLELTIYILPNKAEILGKNILINENEYLSDTQIANGDIIKFI